MNTPIIKRDTAGTDEVYIVIHETISGDETLSAEICYVGRMPTQANPLTNEELEAGCLYDERSVAIEVSLMLHERLDLLDPARSYEVVTDAHYYAGPFERADAVVFLQSGQDPRYLVAMYSDHMKEGENTAF